MIKLGDFFTCINDFLPEGEKVEQLSIFPLPYENYYEIFVQTESKKRFRALATPTQTVSAFKEMELVQNEGVQYGKKC